MKWGHVNLKQLFLGTAFLLAVPLWSWYIAPYLTKLPSDFNFSAEVVSVDNFFDEERGEYAGGIYSKTNYYYEVLEATNERLIVKNIFDVRTTTDDPIFSVERSYGVNRYTGEHWLGYGDRDRGGYLFAPRNLVAGQPFTYWHVNYDGPASMEFVEIEYLYGLKTFRYQTNYEDIVIDQTEDLAYLPGVGTERGIVLEPYLEIWVEPKTGRLIKYEDVTTAYYYDLETGEIQNPWNRFSNTFDEASIQRTAASVQITKTLHVIVDIYIPIIFGLLALWFFGQAGRLWSFLNRYYTRERLVFSIGLLVVTVSSLSLVGWLIGAEQLITIFPNTSGMNPLTAICFLLLGSAVVLAQKKMRLGYLIVSSVLILVGVIRILGSLQFIDFDIDLILFKEAILGHPTQARMAMYTAVAFTISGLSLFAGAFRLSRRLHVADILATVVLLLSTLALFGFLFESLYLLEIPIFFSAAVHTALLFLVSSIAIHICFRGEKDLAIGGWLGLNGLFFVLITITIIISGFVDRRFADEVKNQFYREAEQATLAIEDRLDIYISALEGGRGLFRASDSVERDEWAAYVDALDIQNRYPGIQGMGYSVFVTPEDRDGHVQSIRDEGFSEYGIKPEGERSIYTAIIYLEPFDIRNQQAFGYDMFSNLVRRSAMEQARDTVTPKISGRITLVQEIDTDVQPGFLIYVPHYNNKAVPDNVIERRENIVGYVYSPFRARDMVEGVIGEQGLENIALIINDGVSKAAVSELYNDYDQKFRDNQSIIIETTDTIYVGDRPWTLTYYANPNFYFSLFSVIAPIVVIVIGVIISILITSFFYITLRSRQAAVDYADKVTRDLRLTNENLKSAKAKDEAVLSSIADGLIVTGKDGDIVFVNSAFEQILGWTKSEVTGKELSQLIPMLDEEDKPVSKENRLISKALLNKTLTSSDYWYQRKDGRKFPVYITVAPIVVDGQNIGAVEVFRDITEAKQIDQAKTEFVSLASHQLRTPLSTINWYAEMLLAGDAGPINEEQKKYLNEVYRGNQRMVELVNSLLNVSRLELGTFVVEPEETNIVDLMKSVVDEQMPQVKNRKHELKTDYDKTIESISADPKLLRMVFQNLVSNAVKYTPVGGKIEVSLKSNGKMIDIKVKDSGVGIPQEEKSKIFTKLFRATNVRQSDTDGTGLGLYIVKSVIEQSGGTINFESEESKGTTFHVSLPKTGMKKKTGSRSLS